MRIDTLVPRIGRKTIFTWLLVMGLGSTYAQRIDIVEMHKTLLPGWNLVSYPLADTLGIDVALAPVLKSVLVVKDMDAFYTPGASKLPGSLARLTPGNAYFVKVKDSCELSWSVPRLNNCCTVTFPNAFTPGAQANTSFGAKIDSCCMFLNYKLMVYDLFGSLCFTTNSPVGTWDGTRDNVQLKADVYVFKCQYQTAVEVKKIQGNVMLLR